MKSRMHIQIMALLMAGMSAIAWGQSATEEPIVFDQKANATISIKSNPKILQSLATTGNERQQNNQATVTVNPKLGAAYQLSDDKTKSKDVKAEQFRVPTWSISRF